MKHAIFRKLRSQQGASLLLALLFLLICAMVSASILMAAASNVGKRRSNLAEHQTYLALSSAVSLLCDDLNQAEYCAQYTCWETREDSGTVDQDGNPITYTVYHFQQVPGAYTGHLSDMLLANFDALFAQDNIGSSALVDYTGPTWQSSSVPTKHTLTLKPDTGTELDEREVKVELDVQSSYAIYLTATLNDYTIEAELTPIQSRLTLPASLQSKDQNEIQRVGPMQWKIGWITTGGAAADETTPTEETTTPIGEEAAP